MQDIRVVTYSESNKDAWNSFLSESNQDTFLFHRDFMEYHSDRFQDYSLMVYKDEKLIALLPANRIKDVLYSHLGLTYGGFVYSKYIKTSVLIEMFGAVLKFLQDQKINTLSLKELPTIYLRNQTNNPLQYLLFKVKARLTRMDMHSVVKPSAIVFSKSRKEGYKRGLKSSLRVVESDNFELFWNSILIPNLESKHGVKPVHSLEEIELLKSKFSNNIRQFNVFKDTEIVAGTTIFETNNVAHCQYISGNTDKNELGSLDFLHINLLSEVFSSKAYFSFGTSNLDSGQSVNEGLQFWKEGFGARSITQGFHEIETKNHKLLDSILV